MTGKDFAKIKLLFFFHENKGFYRVFRVSKDWVLRVSKDFKVFFFAKKKNPQVCKSFKGSLWGFGVGTRLHFCCIVGVPSWIPVS